MRQQRERQRESFRANPEDAWTFEALEEAYFLNGEWRELAQLYRERLDAPQIQKSAKLRSRLLCRLAQVAEERCQDLDGAVEHYWEAVRLDPCFRLALWHLRRIHTQRGQWDLVLQISELEEQTEMKREERATFFADVGEVWLERLGQAKRALACFERGLDVDPDLDRALAGAARALEELERPRDAAVRWERLVASGRGSRRADARLALARLESGPLKRPVQALEQLEHALRDDPSNRAALAALASLAEKLERWELIAQLYEPRCEATQDPAEQAAIALQTGLIEMQQLDRPDRARQKLERAAELRPDDSRAFEALIDLERRIGDTSSLLAILERHISASRGGAPTSVLLEAADLLSELGRDEDALAHLERACQQAPDNAVVLETLSDSLTQLGRFEDLAVALERRVGLAGEHDEARAETLAELGRIYEQDIGDPSAAADAYERALEADPELRETAGRLTRLLQRSENWAALRDFLQREGERGAEPSRAQAQRALGDLTLTRFRDPAAAETAYSAALELDPADLEALRGLQRVAVAVGDEAALVTATLREVDCCPDPDVLAERLRGLESLAANGRESARSAARHTRARLEEVLADRECWSALREQLASRLGTDGGQYDCELHERLALLCRDRLADGEACIVHLESAARLEPGRAELWEQLASLYEAGENLVDLARVLEAELETPAASGRELELRFRAARAQRASGHGERAARHFERCLELDPAQPEALEFLIDRSQAAGDSEEVARLLETRLEAETDTPDSSACNVSLRLRLARVRHEQLGDRAGAIAVLEPALEVEPGVRACAEFLEPLLRDAEQAEDRIQLCERALAASEDAQEQAVWRQRLAEALRGRGQPADLVRAEEIYRRSLALEPASPAVREALRDVLRRLEQAEPLAEQIELELAAEPACVSPSELGALRMEWAELLRGPLTEPGRALELLLEVLQLEPNNPQASTQALALAEQLGQPAVQLALLDAKLEQNTEPLPRARIQEARVGLLTGALDRPAEAVDAMREVLCLNPRRDDLRNGLCEALASLSRWPELLEELWTLASEASADERNERLAELARVATTQLPDDDALPWLERLRAAQPRDAGLLNEIAKIHRQAGRSRALLGVLEAELSLIPPTERGLELQRECARILEHELDSRARAIRALEAARRLAPEDPELLSELERLYAAEGRLYDRATALEAQIDLATEGDRQFRTSLHRSAAAVWTTLLQPQSALRHRLCAVSLCETNPSAERAELLGELTTTLCQAGRPELAVRSEEAELACLGPETSARRLELHRSLAARYARAGARPRAALAHLDRFFALAQQQPKPEGAPSDVALEWAETARLELLRSNGDVVGLATCLESRLRSNDRDADAWLELARLREEQLCAPLAASQAYREAVRLRPEDRLALRGLRGAAERVGDWREVAKTLEKELELGGEPEERAALLRSLGAVRSTRLGAKAGAAEAYARALELSPNELGALRALQELRRGEQSWQDELGLCENELQMLGESEASRRRDLWLRIAELTRDHTDDPQRALQAFEQASGCGALPAERLHEWAAHCERTGDRERHAEVFCAWCDDASTAATDADHRFAAELLEQLGETERALTRVQRALALSDRDPANWDTAARLYEAQGDVESAADAVECAAQLHSGREAALRLARAAELVMASDLSRAESLLVRASEIDPAAVSINARLAGVAAERENWETALRAAERSLDLASTGAAEASAGADERLEAALAGGRAARAQNKPEPAARFFEAALAIVPDCELALEGLGEVLHQLGDAPAAARALERRLQLPGENPRRALHLTIAGEGRERDGNPEGALERYREALSLDPAESLAHQGTVRIQRALGRVDDAVKALERWAENSAEAGQRARHRWSAAQLEFDSGRLENAERLLRSALEESSSCEPAWRLLAELLDNAERGDEALTVAGRALDFVTSADDRAVLAGIQARALAARGDDGEAADAYVELLAADPRCTSAAIACGRLLRGLGRWSDAEQALAQYAAQHPDPDEPELACVFAERARLLSGPLERLEEALSCYERAIELDPGSAALRAELARSLTHDPGRQRDAIRLHAALLAEDPTRSESLRAVAKIAKVAGRDALRTRGIALLAALGCASPEERSEVPSALPLRAPPRAQLTPSLWESLRRAVLESSAAFPGAFGVIRARPPTAPGDGPVQAFREAHRLALAKLCAPGLWAKTNSELCDALRRLCGVVFAQSPGGPLAAKLEDELGARGRRRVRREFAGAELEDLLAIDFAKWRQALSELAAVAALEARDGDLRCALIALSTGSPEPSGEAQTPGPGVDIRYQVSCSESARSLLAQIVRAWCADVEAAQS